MAKKKTPGKKKAPKKPQAKTLPLPANRSKKKTGTKKQHHNYGSYVQMHDRNAVETEMGLERGGARMRRKKAAQAKKKKR